MTSLAICEQNYFHLGLRCGQIDNRFRIFNLDKSHGPCRSFTAVEGELGIETSNCKLRTEDEAAAKECLTNYVEPFTCKFRREDEAAAKIWQGLGGTPLKGGVGMILPQFQKWYQTQNFTCVDLTGLDLVELPESITNLFKDLKELNLSGNERLWKVPLNLRVKHIDLSGTNVMDVPYLENVQEITMLDTLADVPDWLADKKHNLKTLTLDSRIINGNPPQVLSRIPDNIRFNIGDVLKGSAKEIQTNWKKCVYINY